MRIINRENDIIKNVAEKLNVKGSIVREVYKLQYKFIIDTLRSYNYNRNYTQEEARKELRGFNINGIGKFYLNLYSINQRYNRILEKQKEL